MDRGVLLIDLLVFFAVHAVIEFKMNY